MQQEHSHGTEGKGAAWANTRRLVWLTILLGIAGCTPASTRTEPIEPASPAVSDAPQPSAVSDVDHLMVDILGDAVEVRVPGPNPVEVHLEFPSGHQMTAITNANGTATIGVSLNVLLPNADSGLAVVTVGGQSQHVDLTPLIEAARRDRAAEWEALVKAQKTNRDLADKSVSFTGSIFHDKNPNPLVEKCTPVGEEVCFDGVDNDCDGRYDDVGCGYSSGVLQWTLTWEGDADLDLFVAGPDGQEVHAGRPHDKASRLSLEQPCKSRAAACAQRKVENVLIPAEQTPLSGTYQARVEVRDAPISKTIQARISGRIGGHTWHTDVALAPFVGADYRIAFPIGGDTDGDRVTNEHDACPEEPGCWFEDLKYRGCPDKDADGVVDKIDACVGKTGLTRDDPKLNGCPIVFGDAWVTNQGIQIQRRIEFATGKADLTPDSERLIKDIAEAIQAYPQGVERMSIDGHTDDVGDDENNIQLSNRRAQAVLAALAKKGVSGTMLTTRGYGETKPIADNDSPENRQKNRRVEFVILRPAPRTSECW